MDEESHNIDHKEDPEVELRTNNRVLRADRFDEVSKCDVDCSSDKDWADDECGNLQKKGDFVVGTFVGPGTTNPSDKLDVRRNC